MKQQDVLGWHWLVDFSDCRNMPQEPHALEEILVNAAELAGATVVQTCFHRFSPHGLSGVVVIAESHLAAHTWPEHRAICLDLFSCSASIHAQIAIDFVSKKVQATETRVQQLVRGEIP